MNEEKVLELVNTYGSKVILFFVSLVLTNFASKLAKSATMKSLNKAKLERNLQLFLSKIVKWLVLIAGGVYCLGIFGVQTASFAAILASMGFAIGMALQGTLGNFASGVMLLIFRPFKPGDAVNIAGTTGKVVEVDIFNTALDTADNRRIIIPNGQVFGSKIENIGFHSTRRVDVAVGTDYSANLEETRKALFNAISTIDQGLETPEPAVVLQALGASSIDWSVRLWVKAADYWPVHDQLTKAVKEELDKQSIGIPFPQMEMHMKQK